MDNCLEIIDLPVRVEDSSTRRLASDGLVKNRREILTLLERGVKSGNGNYSPGGLYLGRGPNVPGEADAIAILDIIDVHGVGLICSYGDGKRECCVWGNALPRDESSVDRKRGGDEEENEEAKDG